MHEDVGTARQPAGAEMCGLKAEGNAVVFTEDYQAFERRGSEQVRLGIPAVSVRCS